VLAGIGAAAGYYYYDQTHPPSILGKSSEQFVPTAGPNPTTTSPAHTTTPAKHARTIAIPWPTYGYDPQRTHVSPYPLRPPYRKLWFVRTGYYIEYPPIVAYGRLFLAQQHGRFYAIDAKTGKLAWVQHFAPMCTAASPAVWHGVVYQPYLPPPCSYGDRSQPGLIVGMAEKTGRIVWRLRGPASESSPLVLGHTMYFGSWDHNLYALNLATHKVRWKFLADGELNSSPAYAGGTIYIGSHEGTIYAVDASTGKERWSAHSFSRFGSREEFYATPAVAYGRVYAGNADGHVYSFGASTGDLIWAQPAGTYVYSAPAVWNKTVYVGSYDGNVYAFDAATGRLRWTYASPGSIHGGPTIMDGLVYYSVCGTCGSHGSRYAKLGPRSTFALDARTGKLVWKYPDGRYSPVVADQQHMYMTGDTWEYAFVPKAAVKAGRAGARGSRSSGPARAKRRPHRK